MKRTALCLLLVASCAGAPPRGDHALGVVPPALDAPASSATSLRVAAPTASTPPPTPPAPALENVANDSAEACAIDSGRPPIDPEAAVDGLPSRGTSLRGLAEIHLGQDDADLSARELHAPVYVLRAGELQWAYVEAFANGSALVLLRRAPSAFCVVDSLPYVFGGNGSSLAVIDHWISPQRDTAVFLIEKQGRFHGAKEGYPATVTSWQVVATDGAALREIAVAALDDDDVRAVRLEKAADRLQLRIEKKHGGAPPPIVLNEVR